MLWFQFALTPHGWLKDVRVHLASGLIAKVESGVAPAAIDERHGAAFSGLHNLHSHAFQRGMAGLAEIRGPADDNFWTWREVMYRFLDRLGPEEVEAIAAQAYVEMLERGFVRVGEFHYLHRDPSGKAYANVAELAERVVAAADQTGIGLTLLPVFYAHSDFGGAPPKPGQRRFLSDPGGFARLLEQSRHALTALPDANIGVAPHSLRAVTPEELAEITALAPSGPIHIHAAEQMKEVADCVACSGMRPVAWLLAEAQIDARWCLVHATHLTPAETAGLAGSGAVAGLCPVTEANLGDGIFPSKDYLDLGGRFGVGTDSNVAIDAADELKMLEYAQRLTARSRNLLAPVAGRSTGRSLFEAACAGGAQALGLAPGFGLREGAPADFVSVDLEHPAFAGRRGDTILDSWIFGRGPLDCVWRRGHKVVAQGRHRNREAVRLRYLRVMEAVLA